MLRIRRRVVSEVYRQLCSCYYVKDSTKQPIVKIFINKTKIFQAHTFSEILLEFSKTPMWLAQIVDELGQKQVLVQSLYSGLNTDKQQFKVRIWKLDNFLTKLNQHKVARMIQKAKCDFLDILPRKTSKTNTTLGTSPQIAYFERNTAFHRSIQSTVSDRGLSLANDETPQKGCIFNFIRYIQAMWKSIGSVKHGEQASFHSNRSRCDINVEPFHLGLKRKSHLSPDTNRSFCYEYFEKRRNKTLNESIPSNKSERNLVSLASNQDIFTEMRNKANKEDQGSRITDRVRQNPQTESISKKRRQQLRKASGRIHTLKKEQNKLKNTMQNEFNAFKNLFYQLEQHLHQQNQAPRQPTAEVDEAFFRDILGEAMGIERYFQQMDRKKTALMQKLAD